MTAIVLLERGARWRGDGAARARSASCSRSATTTSAPTCGWRGVFVFGTIVLFTFFFFAHAPPARCSRGCARCSRRLRVERPLPRVLRRRPPLPRPPATADRRVRVHDRDAGRADPRHLGGGRRRSGSTLEPRIYFVMGPLFFLVLLVPFTLNGFAVREAFFVSFLGSGGCRRRSGVRGRRSSSSSSPSRSRCPARRSSSGRGFTAAAPGRASSMAEATVACRRRHLRRAAVDRAAASRASPASRPSSSTTARRTARLERRARSFPEVTVVEQEQPRARRRLEPRPRRDEQRLRPDPQRRRLARRRRARRGSSSSRETPARRGRDRRRAC